MENPYGGETSLLAEWMATVEALRWAQDELQTRSLLLRVDAALVAKGLRDRRVTMSGYEGALAIEARDHLAELKARGVHVHVERVPRWRNADADGLAQEAVAGDLEEGACDGLTPGIPPPSRRRRASPRSG